MWWLRFEEGNAAVVAATSLVQARLIAAATGLDERRSSLKDTRSTPTFCNSFPKILSAKSFPRKKRARCWSDDELC